MTTALTYVIKFVGDMDAAVAFHVSQLELKLRFKSAEWSEFETGSTTLALHTSSAENPPGSCELGFGVPDIDRFYATGVGKGLKFISPPTDLHGQKIASARDSDGAKFSVSGA